MEFSKFQEVEGSEIIKIAETFIKAEQSLFKKYKNTGNFFRDFREAINKYLDEYMEQTKKFLEPFRKEAERSLQRVYKTIKSIQNIVPKVTIPDLSTFDKLIKSEAFKSPEIIHQENDWKRHKELMDSLYVSLKVQEEILKEQKTTGRSTRWVLFVAILALIAAILEIFCK